MKFLKRSFFGQGYVYNFFLKLLATREDCRLPSRQYSQALSLNHGCLHCVRLCGKHVQEGYGCVHKGCLAFWEGYFFVGTLCVKTPELRARLFTSCLLKVGHVLFYSRCVETATGSTGLRQLSSGISGFFVPMHSWTSISGKDRLSAFVSFWVSILVV